MDFLIPENNLVVPALSLRYSFEKVSGWEFSRMVYELSACEKRFADNLTLRDNYDDFDCWMLNTSRGFAVSRNHELINVFSSASCGDRARGILDFAKSKYEKLILNCFSGKNEQIYLENGFSVTRREANWDGPDAPDVVYMQWVRSP